MKTLNLIGLATLIAALPLTAMAGCPDLSGSYTITNVSSVDGSSNAPTGALIVITQTGCEEVDVVTGNSQGSSVEQKYITDGKPHTWASIGDVGVTFTVVSQFQDNALVGTLGMTTMPNQAIGTIEYSLDSTGKILTFSMTVSGEVNSATAVRQ